MTHPTPDAEGGAWDVLAQLIAAGDDGGPLGKLVQGLLGCDWGHGIRHRDDPTPCHLAAVQIVVLHSGPREMAFKLCARHRDFVLSETTPPNTETQRTKGQAMIANSIVENVLDVYCRLTRDDAEGAWNPYYPEVARAAGQRADLAYLACKMLKRAGLLDCNGSQRGGFRNAPGYWATEKALAE